MPRRSISLEEQARNDIAEEVASIVDRLVAEAGPAPDAESVSDDALLEQWGQRDPNLGDPEQIQQQMMTTGLGQFPDLFDPNNPQALGVVQAMPETAQEWAAMLAEPVDQEVADMLMPLIEHPFRVSILAPYADDPDEMVRVSDSFDRRWQRKHGMDATPAGGQVSPVQQPAPSATPMMNGTAPPTDMAAPMPPMQNGAY